ncbi:hypothetical protein C7H19_19540 [Aphanothece hegewaldii CCALA 016]|uniref:Type II toxin-antitoxin system ParD family antitoxin n=2 Tax=Aphanothece TaxID=1121 RepID=A0A2T1LTD9_9CHRO|nr:hypothetical protein C7H19_19540 [Aphanothece hegewaldii CCALA 016]
MQIILTFEQEQFLQEQLISGRYSTPQEVITEAFKLLSQRDKPKQKIDIIKGKEAEKNLKEQVKKFRQELKESRQKPLASEQLKLSQELNELFDKTQSISEIQDITEEEIAAEIEAYRRGE